MVLMTIIYRVSRCLPLVRTIMYKELETGRDLQEDECKAKEIAQKLKKDESSILKLFRKKKSNEPLKESVQTTGSCVFHYLLEDGVCYLVLCESSFSKLQAFSFLEDVQVEFMDKYSETLSQLSEPYCCREFDQQYSETDGIRQRRVVTTSCAEDLTQVEEDVEDLLKMQRDLQEIMDEPFRQNIVLPGETLSDLEKKASSLYDPNQRFLQRSKKDSRYLKSSYTKMASIFIIIIIFLVFVRYWLF